MMGRYLAWLGKQMCLLRSILAFVLKPLSQVPQTSMGYSSAGVKLVPGRGEGGYVPLMLNPHPG